jgi:hypothetical protein
LNIRCRFIFCEAQVHIDNVAHKAAAESVARAVVAESGQ